MNTDNIIVVYGPSGSGQDSVVEGITKRFDSERVITTSSRSELRAGESQGKPYWFISQEEFEEGIRDSRFIEWAQTYNGAYYGVTRDEVERVANSGKLGIWKVDWKGAKSIRKLFPEIPILFVTAPLESLRERLIKRDNPDEEYLKERMEYDYTIENLDGQLKEAIEQAEQIIRERFPDTKAL
jgi:guanylate kinase